MLLPRVITALLLVVLVLLGIYYLPNLYFSLAAGAVLSIAAWEWCAIIRSPSLWQRLAYLILVWLGFLLAGWMPPLIVLGLGCGWWLLAIYLVVHYAKDSRDLRFESRSRQLLYLLIGLLILIPCWVGIVELHRLNKHYLLLVLLLVWAADTGAYFAGTWFGKHKLAPKLSPKKTVEGLLGGLLLALMVAVVCGWFTGVVFIKWWLWGGIIIATVLFSVLGDLFESMIKRQANIKDSGNWLPGHGGVLDRVDSLMAAIPVFALGVLVIIV